MEENGYRNASKSFSRSPQKQAVAEINKCAVDKIVCSLLHILAISITKHVGYTKALGFSGNFCILEAIQRCVILT